MDTDCPPGRALVVVVGSLTGDPVRCARIVSALVNNTRLALRQVRVGATTVYPVDEGTRSDEVAATMEFTFRLRSTTLVLDQLLVEQIVDIVSSVGRVISHRREL